MPVGSAQPHRCRCSDRRHLEGCCVRTFFVQSPLKIGKENGESQGEGPNHPLTVAQHQDHHHDHHPDHDSGQEAEQDNEDEAGHHRNHEASAGGRQQRIKKPGNATPSPPLSSISQLVLSPFSSFNDGAALKMGIVDGGGDGA